MAAGEQSASDLPYYSARPTLRIDGQDNDVASRQLQSMRMREAEGGLSALELTLVNWSSDENGGARLAFENEQVFRFGAELKVYCGEAAGPTEVFAGKISGLELAFAGDGPPQLVVHAEDSAMKARLARRIQVYEQMSVADLAREVATRMGATPVISGLADATDTWVQFNESDLGFLRRVLARHGADCQVVGAELHVSPRGDVRRNEVTLRLHSQLRRVRAVADLAQQATEVRITGFDAAQGSAFEGTGSGAPLGPGQGRQGAELLRQVFGERTEQVAHHFAGTQSEARALAEAQFASRARGFVRVEGTAEGNPSLRVGTHLSLQDVSPRFDNTYYVVACAHRFDSKHGYETDFVAEGAHLGEPA